MGRCLDRNHLESNRGVDKGNQTLRNSKERAVALIFLSGEDRVFTALILSPDFHAISILPPNSIVFIKLPSER